ncbi:cysteine proteinase inhibitor A-like [Typha angustifolia]|uniref:cysteine proteinase inhibitor A-like n=1 Tax=Typha angustifolia TaxID=59011 RepID=UPI003C2EA40F
MDSVLMRRLFVLCSISALVLCCLTTSVMGGGAKAARNLMGGVCDSKPGMENSLEMEDLARFAVDEHNKKENALLQFVRVVKVRQQVVAGMLYYLTIEALDGGNKKLYEAKVWVKPWMKFKELEDFKLAAGLSTSAEGI